MLAASEKNAFAIDELEGELRRKSNQGKEVKDRSATLPHRGTQPKRGESQRRRAGKAASTLQLGLLVE
ncbi:unnamed protein product [Parnassius apollo]|uniref:(apollo) hypothetical protein n=1 Tax=Parnassius apollo TaxID=110799 RepID=A0A8S3XXS2_PARAO|nr:unnamed protein product [Parnassius apollo]